MKMNWELLSCSFVWGLVAFVKNKRASQLALLLVNEWFQCQEQWFL